MYFMPDYHPEWLVGCAAIRDVHGQRLAALVGRRLSQVWLLWNLKSDSYFGDGPVIMDFDGVQVEICHQRFADVSITWGGVDPRKPLEASSFPVALRGMDRFAGQSLTGVELLEWTARDANHGNVAVHFGFGDGGLSVHNWIDSTQLSFDPPDPFYERHHL